ncbi:MAG: hypothetical protein WCA13_18020, partial [Terriglobales bacterium]
MIGPFPFDKLLTLLALLGILLLANISVGQSSTSLLRLQRSRAYLNVETNVLHAQGYSGLTDNKSASVFNYPNSLSCLVVYDDGKYVLEKREESTVGKPKIKLAEGTLAPDDFQHLKAILDDDALKKIGTPKAPTLPDDAVTVREFESVDAQIDHANTTQHFTTIKERVKTTAATGMDTYIDNGAPYQKTLNPLLKWFEGLEKKSKSELKESKPQYCVPMNIG